MSKIRIVYIMSFVILGVLVVSALFYPMISKENYSTVARESLIQTDDEWIIQFDIVNREGKDQSYVINWSTAGETYNSMSVQIKEGQTFTYIHHVYPETVKEGKIRLYIYKEGENTPFEDSTYYINFD